MRKEELFETFGNINSQYIKDAHVNKKKKEGFVWIKWASVAACVLVIAVISMPVVRDFIDPKSNSIDIVQDDTSVVDQSQNTPINDNSLEALLNEKEVKLIVNKVDSMLETVPDADVKIVSYDKVPKDVWDSILEEFYEFTGIAYEDFTSGLSASGEIYNFHSLSTRGYKDGWVEDEYYLHDYVFGYRTENGGEATIALSSVGKPLRDYYLYCENPQQSEINGVLFVIYEYENMYLAQFSYESVSYDIATINMTLEELETLLVAIIDTSEATSEDSAADANGDYHEAVNSNDLTKDTSEFFGGSYLNSNGKFVVVLTEDTAENRATICKELGISESNTTFQKGVYTLAYLTELQAKISNAMINKEIPFVVSSSVSETINKIKVRATTDDETELAELYALDTIGGAIEIEYVSENSMPTHELLINKTDN